MMVQRRADTTFQVLRPADVQVIEPPALRQRPVIEPGENRRGCALVGLHLERLHEVISVVVKHEELHRQTFPRRRAHFHS